MTIATQHTPLSYDYVLVAKTIENQEREAVKKQTEYIEELKKKNLKVTVSLLWKTEKSFSTVGKVTWFFHLSGLYSSYLENHRR